MTEEELREFATSDESAFELINRTATEPIPLGVFFLGSLRSGQVLEISGASGLGKSEILIQAALQCILPKEAQGSSENVLFVDLDGKFDPLRLIQVHICNEIEALHARVSTLQHPGERDPLMQAALRRFHLVKCRSSFELLAVLRSCLPLIKKFQDQGGLRLLLLDNIAAQYWVDRARKPAPSSAAVQAPSALSLHAVHVAVTSELRQILRASRCAAIATKHAMVRGISSTAAGAAVAPQAAVMDPQDAGWTPRDFLPQAWLDMVSHRVIVRGLSGAQDGIVNRFAAKWHKPGHDQVYVYQVTDADVRAC